MFVYKELKNEYAKEVRKVTRPIWNKGLGINLTELKEIQRKAVEKVNFANQEKLKNFSETNAREFDRLHA